MNAKLDIAHTILRILGGASALALVASTSTGCIAYATVVDEPVALQSADGSATVEVFYDELSPYGEWVEIEGHGRVWRPAVAVVGPDFVPYTSGGHWVATDQGWAFESGWAWGWAPFHYGRWMMQPGYGWVWVPDTVWASSWVEWRHGGGYVGWAPMGPSYAVGYAPTYVFVESAHFVESDCTRYRVPADRASIAYASTVSVHDEVHHGGARWFRGPQPEVIEREVGAPVRRYPVTAPRPGQVVNPRAGGSYERRGAGDAGPSARYQQAPGRASQDSRAMARVDDSRAMARVDDSRAMARVDDSRAMPRVDDSRAMPRPDPRPVARPDARPSYVEPRATPVVNQPRPAAVNAGYRPAPVARPAPVSRPAVRAPSAPAAPSRASSGRRR